VVRVRVQVDVVGDNARDLVPGPVQRVAVKGFVAALLVDSFGTTISDSGGVPPSSGFA